MIRRPPRSTQSRSSAASDVYKRQAESQFGDSAARYSHADWARGQQVEPACHAPMRYIALGRPPALPDDLLSCFPSHQRPSFSEIQELAGKRRLHTTDDDAVLLVRQSTPQPASNSQSPVGRISCFLNDEPIRPLRTAAHAPLGHAGLSLDSFLPPRHNANPARTFLLCLLYTSPSPRDKRQSRMPSSA